MKLRQAIRYYELTGADYLTDLKKFAEYQRAMFEFNHVYDDYTEVLATFATRLGQLYVDESNELKTDDMDFDDVHFLIKKYTQSVPKEEKEDNSVLELSDNHLRKKVKGENMTLNLVSSIIGSDIDLTQFLDMNIEVVSEILELSNEKKEKARKKNKKKGL
ncbi:MULTISPECIES: hypothetical protein [unclassified Lactococcus]|uniref:hypothetical protein n=1 Tax=unclassified Lactococcus TaxID=2643510 RepID=UPI0011CBDC0F|nr:MULTISPECIES: hypothetical protein [unclassified Lactococcus]MQW22001.1 hypothetical protein [Lactococcus sp. dk101]TXK36819.1 hypothetical protein FVP42_10610 [Lactococcus sp. dk310]TXK47484.1 hypothetical protein FVP43_10235 [Lactococcus sp. dk322]